MPTTDPSRRGRKLPDCHPRRDAVRVNLQNRRVGAERGPRERKIAKGRMQKEKVKMSTADVHFAAVPGAPAAFRYVDMMHPFKSFLWGKDLAVLDHGLAGDCGTFSAPGPLFLHRQG